MDKRKLNWITLIFVVLTVFVVGLMLSNTLRRSSHITLPDTNGTTGQILDNLGESSALTIVEIDPETVQTAIATLSRPQSYRRSITIEQFWTGGSGSYRLTASVNGDWTRTDRVMPDGQIRHSITDGKSSYIWYNEEREYAEAPAGGISADNEQSVPTYESVLELPVESIVEADYRDLSGLHCIYVETAPDTSGYVLRYWVSVDTGLLVSAEKLLDGRVVYRMSAPEVDQTEPDMEWFALPDGTQLTQT